MLVPLYVDDIIYAYSNNSWSNKFASDMKSCFDMVDMGDISWYLGMKINNNHKNSTFTMNQTQYAKSILELYGLTNTSS